MIPQDKISSGYDIEFLLGEEYLRHLFMTLFETGSLAWWTESETKDEQGNHVKTDTTILHPPEILNQKRLYDVLPEFVGNEHPFIDLVQVYSTQDEELKVTILNAHPLDASFSVKVFPTIVLNSDDPEKISPIFPNLLFTDLDIKISILHDEPDRRGLVGNIRLNIELVDISGSLIETALRLLDENGNPIYTKEGLLADLKEGVDREFPFSVSGGGSLQKIAVKIFADDSDVPNAIGIYINLGLKNGPAPDDFLPDHGDLSQAQNFMPADAQMAFGISDSTLPRLADDLFQKMAVLKAGSTDEYHYPFMDGTEQKGRIKGVSIYPQRIVVGNAPTVQFTNTLILDVHGEYELNNLPDPDFHLLVKLKPVNKNGLLDFEVEYDVELSAIGILLLELGISFFLPVLGITLFLLTGIAIEITERILANKAAEKIEGEGDITSFLDAIPHKLVIETRRWDPLYFTLHQLQIFANHIAVNDQGLAFSAGTIFIGRRFEPAQDGVIRNVSRDVAGAIDGLFYRVVNFADLENTDFKAIYPAVDRMLYREAIPPNPPVDPHHRINLTFDQIAERMNESKILKSIPYKPQKINVIDNQIFKLFALSDLELAEISALTRRALKRELLAQNGPVYRVQAINELTVELGRTPTEDEIAVRVDKLVNVDVITAFPDRFLIELDLRMTLELEPSEFAELQQKKTLELGSKQLEIIERRGANGEVTVYYRDIRNKPRPEPPVSDNLLDLRRY